MFYLIFLALIFYCPASMLEAASKNRTARWISFDPEKETCPFLLPMNHPDSETIRDIFFKTDAELNLETITNLGFSVLDAQGLHVHVAKHPQVRGYVFKFFKYKDFPGIDWQHWVKRVRGARIIQEAIVELGFDKIFKVPKKWLIKTNSSQLINGTKYPCYVLMAEDVKPKPKLKNHIHWRTRSTEPALSALHKMLKTYGLRDSARVSNVPYCFDGKIAFVDTEAFHTWPVNYHPLLEFLNSRNKKIWSDLVKADGDKMAAY